MTRLLWLALLPALLHAEFLAGMARIEITPPLGVAMAGYAARKGGATGVHDPLYATALVMKNGEVSVAYVVLDLIGMNAPAVEQQVAQQFGIPNTVLISIHTHSGPDRSAADWWKDAQAKIVTVVGQARANLRPARIGAATGQAALGYNRRQVLPDGQVKMLWSNPQKLPTDPLDNTVSVLRIDDPSGNPRAILVNYAVHPVTLGEDGHSVERHLSVAPATYDAAIVRFIPGYEEGSARLAPRCGLRRRRRALAVAAGHGDRRGPVNLP